MPLYTEEQLSMIMGMHAAGRLVLRADFGLRTDSDLLAFFGLRDSDGTGCINQIAFNEPDADKAANGYGEEAKAAAEWFDWHYSPDMPVSRLLRKLESF